METLTSRLATALWRRRHPGIDMSHPDREIPHIELRARDVPKLALDKARAWRFRRGVTDVPWITPQAIELLDGLLLPTDEGIEFGSGSSTIWLGRKCARVRSVDGFRHWYEPLAARVKEAGLGNVTLRLADADLLGYESAAHQDAYVGAYPELEQESQDWVFIDGEYRDATFERGLRLLKPGGLLILDNAESFIPIAGRTGWVLDEPATPLWADLMREVGGWRSIWTTDGISDTVIWVKPVG